MKGKKNNFFIIVIFAVVSVCVMVRVLSYFGAEEKIMKYMSELSENESFVKYAVAGQTPLVEGDTGKFFLNMAFSETAVDVGDEDEAENEVYEETVVEIEVESGQPEREELTVWEYTIGGEKTEKTYPIENITIKPVTSKGYVVYENVWVKNDSTKGIDVKWLLNSKLPFKLVGDGPHVLIIHTHGSESYLPQGRDFYTLTDVERTEDKRYNVISVGDELENALKENGISVIHDRNIYDSPSYNGSYTRALDAIGKTLKANPTIKVVVDLHRDAMTNADGVKYRTVANVNGKQMAQMMLVMSTGESGLPHPDWAENLKLAVKLQNVMSEKYPGIMRPVNLRKERFNMHATTGSMLVEVGTSANSLSEAKESVKLLGKELAEILKKAK
ncbi:MAG: stage II sporulation protein P [Oscillospiraceae bacterium]|nr:stage II sporulation protein P [Oscillospiraceae bacterium]